MGPMNPLEAYENLIQIDLKKLREMRPQYQDLGITLIGFMESGQEFDYDIFYSLSGDFAVKHPGHEFFAIFRFFKEDLEVNLNKTVDLVDVASLEPIGQEDILETIYKL